MPTLLYAAALDPNKIGGVESFCFALASALQRFGWNLVFCGNTEPSESVRKELSLPNFSFDVLRYQKGIGLRQAGEFARVVMRHRPEILVYHLGGILRTYPRISKLLLVKKVFYHDGTSRPSENVALPWGGPKMFVARFLASPIDEVIAISSYVARCVSKENIVSADRVHVIRFGVNHRGAEDQLKHAITGALDAAYRRIGKS